LACAVAILGNKSAFVAAIGIVVRGIGGRIFFLIQHHIPSFETPVDIVLWGAFVAIFGPELFLKTLQHSLG
jgi:hypothetical protein